MGDAILWLSMTALFVLAWGIMRRRARRRLEAWAAEEDERHAGNPERYH